MLIAYIISPPNTVARPSSTIRPGTLPTPDAWGNSNYDGTEDNQCLGNTTNGLPWVGSTSTTKRCLGKLPWKTISFDVGPGESHDPLGRVPWLAVSSNLVFYDACLLVLNSDVANLPSPGSSTCITPGLPYPQPSTLPQPWLTVYDQEGNVLSNNVAAVLILPGSPITTETRSQSRTATNPGQPADYLDSINIPLGCTSGCTLYDNAGLNNQFIMVPSGTTYPSNAQNAAKRGQTVPFNDVLVYLTIDEVMYYAEKRVAGEMAKALKTFMTDATTGNTKYPWLQPLSATFSNEYSLYSQPNTILGAFPFMVNDSNAIYRTEFSWNLTGASESTYWESTTGTGTTASPCHQVRTTPSNRWVRNPLITTLNASTTYGGPFATSAAIPVTAGTCKWLGGTKVQCDYDAGSTSSSFTSYSSLTRCNSQTSPSAALTLTVSRNISIVHQASDCTPTPAVKTYSSASGADVHRWSWSCANTAATDIILVIDTISQTGYSGLPRVAKMSSGGTGQNFSLNGMRYHPIMPSWFFHNRWYASAFAAWAPGAANLPATPSPNPCNPETSLKVGGAAVNTGAIILAGRYLPSQTRPSSTLSSYLDGNNTSAGTTCALTNPEQPLSSTLNDNILVLP